ncbi:hypothetical protein Hanom_Chr12g01081611 [Helianthus anomalus]
MYPPIRTGARTLSNILIKIEMELNLKTEVTLDGTIASGITKSGDENIKPDQTSFSDCKYISIVIAPPIDSPNKNAGSFANSSLFRTLTKYDKEVAAALSISPIYP